MAAGVRACLRLSYASSGRDLQEEFKSINLDLASEETIAELENLRERLGARKMDRVIFFWGNRQFIVDAWDYVGYLPYGSGKFFELMIRTAGRVNNHFHNSRRTQQLAKNDPAKVSKKSPGDGHVNSSQS